MQLVRNATTTKRIAKQDRMVGINETLIRLGISRSTLYKRIRDKHFPKSHNPKKGGKAQWPLSVIEDWIAESKRKNRV